MGHPSIGGRIEPKRLSILKLGSRVTRAEQAAEKVANASEVATRAKAPNFIAQRLSGFENPLPRTKVRGYTWTSVFPQPL
jgi:hypothetical protein